MFRRRAATARREEAGQPGRIGRVCEGRGGPERSEPMKERSVTNESSRTGEEPWAATESRWPIATRMSPWAFEGAGSEDGEGNPEPSRH